MSRYRIGIVKSELKLRVFSNDTIVNAYDIAIGERADGKPRIYEEDFRTPEGSFKVKQIWKNSSFGLKLSNTIYYPYYLAHRFGEPFTDLGKGAYGDGIIQSTYPTEEDVTRYQNLLSSGEIESDWHTFMEEKWRAVFKHAAKTQHVPFHEAKLNCERWDGKRFFLEGKPFEELYDSTPPPPELPFAIHGTNDPDCIGHKITGGCIRMHNHDITELIENFVETGMGVDIEN